MRLPGSNVNRYTHELYIFYFDYVCSARSGSLKIILLILFFKGATTNSVIALTGPVWSVHEI